MQKQNDSTLLGGTYQVNQSQHLNYAIKLSRWYDYTWDKIIQKAPLNFNPANLAGYYNYTNNDLTGDSDKDTAYVSVVLTKWNQILHKTDTVGRGSTELGASNIYLPFECTINYFTSAVADTIIIEISPSKFKDLGSYCVTPGYCSYFTVDNLTLNGNGSFTPVNILFPNPATTTIHFNLPLNEHGEARIINMLGQTISKKMITGGSNSFEIVFLSPGMYILQVAGSNDKVGFYKFIKN